MTITAATRKGSGRTNQDRYITGPNFAAVLDGASDFTEEGPERDGGWYAQALGAKLRELLIAESEMGIPQLVERAIGGVASEHDLRPNTSPTSTIALARWDDEHVETYVLGDSTVAIIHPDGSEDAYSDDRLASIGGHLRRAYRERLAAGSGFDDEHLRLLASLQAEQAKWRNREDGYWIAGATSTAASRGIVQSLEWPDVSRIAIASDGAAAAVSKYRLFASWAALAGLDAQEVLVAVEAHESRDGDGTAWARSKRHDDKTLLLLERS
ncbi:protein phosphatase 2C domain-containing protein [Intrasporangium calvum]|uniref:protein phosphatase 2C domain-containing protein n=1 Tax=Intrasporangium calvum TaxID=53358 RepID=UPI00190019FB|nr:protein phosphatase 2C domain-containing protein [Intrasporangium calvum]